MSTLLNDIRRAREKRDVLLMTHLVLGYPSLEVNREVVARMAEAGVDLIELQIPFSEPVADGPVIAKACQEAIAGGVTVRECLDFAAALRPEFGIPFLFMTYYNIPFRFGLEPFMEEARSAGIKGLIVPDLPPDIHCTPLEESSEGRRPRPLRGSHGSAGHQGLPEQVLLMLT